MALLAFNKRHLAPESFFAILFAATPKVSAMDASRHAITLRGVGGFPFWNEFFFVFGCLLRDPTPVPMVSLHIISLWGLTGRAEGKSTELARFTPKRASCHCHLLHHEQARIAWIIHQPQFCVFTSEGSSQPAQKTAKPTRDARLISCQPARRPMMMHHPGHAPIHHGHMHMHTQAHGSLHGASLYSCLR